MDHNKSVEFQKIVSKLRINGIKRHIFFCAGEKCCSREQGQETWEFLKERCRQEDAINAGVYRTKVSCLRICQQGPIALVYPEGTWYRDVNIAGCKKIFEEHLLGGQIVEELKLAENALHLRTPT